MALAITVQAILVPFFVISSLNWCNCHFSSHEDILKRIHDLETDIRELQNADVVQQNKINTHETKIHDLLNNVDSLESQRKLAVVDRIGYNFKRQLSNDGLVAFNAKLSNHANENVTRGHPIIFETVDLNANDGYNWKTGKFTAPSSGIYLFSLSLLSHNYGDGYYVHGEIVHNSQPVARALAVGDPNDNRDQGAVTVFIDVKKGDNIWVRSVDFDKVTVGGDLFSVFCGYLLFPLE